MAATFYTAPVLTFDLDVFILLPSESGGCVMSLDALYGALRKRGYNEEGETVSIEGHAGPVSTGVQCPDRRGAGAGARNRLRRRADSPGGGRNLIAICLQTGRAKDRARVAMLREQAELDGALFADVRKRHHLEKKWTLWAE